MAEMTPKFDLPGFRFHPTEEELLDFYLKRMVFGKKMSSSTTNVIGYLSIYHHDPWDLPGLAKIGEREWYFYVPRERKHGSMGRPSRTTEHGFWKATGSDRKIVSLSEPKRVVGMRKTLVFYKGRAPRGCKTDWVMNEYRLPDSCTLPMDIVLCKIYRKATSMKVLEQRAAALEEEKKAINYNIATPTSPSSSSLCSTSHEDPAPVLFPQVDLKKELEGMELTEEDDHTNNNNNNNSINRDEKAKEMKGSSSSSLQLPMGQEKLPELQVPTLGVDWNQYNIWLSPNWLLNFTAYNNLLNL